MFEGLGIEKWDLLLSHKQGIHKSQCYIIFVGFMGVCCPHTTPLCFYAGLCQTLAALKLAFMVDLYSWSSQIHIDIALLTDQIFFKHVSPSPFSSQSLLVPAVTSGMCVLIKHWSGHPLSQCQLVFVWWKCFGLPMPAFNWQWHAFFFLGETSRFWWALL